MSLSVLAPLAGKVVAVQDVPDPVFAGQFVGPGLAIDPAREGEVTAVAPISGTVAKVHPHAFVVVDPQGRGVLTHLGLDTVSLAGEGFTLHATEGDQVEAGAPMVTWSPAEVEAKGLNPIVPVIALEAQDSALTLTEAGTQLAAGSEAFSWA